ncbi:TPA: hypothetical protein MIQ77_22185, partial [Klebsiella pneumoniae]|nr:hypothetical protein [Klebsiella pneumoniae]
PRKQKRQLPRQKRRGTRPERSLISLVMLMAQYPQPKMRETEPRLLQVMLEYQLNKHSMRWNPQRL